MGWDDETDPAGSVLPPREQESKAVRVFDFVTTVILFWMMAALLGAIAGMLARAASDGP